MKKRENLDLYVISNAETFNKYLLTISSAAFPALWYLIDRSRGSIFGFKIAMALFGGAIILNMLALIIAIDYPDPKGWIDNLIFNLDWLAYILFCIAIVVVYFSMP